MKKRFYVVMFVFLAILFALTAFAGSDHKNHKMPAIPKEFEGLKKLVGKWEGKTKNEKGEDQTLKVSYELTAGGTALLERLFTGNEHEMASMYYVGNGKVAMTHYCMLGNHPELRLKKATDTSFQFEMVGNGGLASHKETHMHGLTITMTDNDHIKHEWILFENGKKKGATVFDLKRD